jgi:MraZ protein
VEFGGKAGLPIGAMFRGATPIALDGKGRLAIPTKYRDMLMQRCGGRLVLTQDPSACLLLYPLPDWEPIEERLNKLPSFDEISRRMQRLLVGSATSLEMDSAGRILLPSLLRDRARLERDVVMIGQGNKFEIWNEAAWNAECDAVANLPAQLSDAVRKGELPSELKGFTL